MRVRRQTTAVVTKPAAVELIGPARYLTATLLRTISLTEADAAGE